MTIFCAWCDHPFMQFVRWTQVWSIFTSCRGEMRAAEHFHYRLKGCHAIIPHKWILQQLNCILKPTLLCVCVQARVMATIGVTRGLGDHDLKVYNSNIYIKPFLSCVPEVSANSQKQRQLFFLATFVNIIFLRNRAGQVEEKSRKV